MTMLTAKELLTLDARSLQKRLETRALTSVELVISCLKQIEQHDRQGAQLQALISVAPRELLLQRASELDSERRSGRVRSSLHGIPLLVKDGIATNSKFGLKTSVGSIALQNSQPMIASPLIDKLHEMGMIVLAKSNLTEFMGVKGFKPPNGWSALCGQTQSAYIAFDPNDTEMGHTNPCGSSTGSAVGVSAGYSPISIGTDSIGSLVSPATRAALYTIKPTVGSVDLSGVWGVSSHLDSIGGLTKSVSDLADITTALVKPDIISSMSDKGYHQFLTGDFHGLRIGFLDSRDWHFPQELCKNIDAVTNQLVSSIEDTISVIRSHEGVHVAYPVSLPPLSALQLDGSETLFTAITYEIKSNIEHYLSTASVDGVTNLEDIVKFNKEHASQELPPAHPSQDWLLQALRDPPSRKKYDKDVSHFRRTSREKGIDKLFREQDLNLLAFSMDSLVFSMASAAGYPIATVPLGLLKENGRPFALGLIAQAGREGLMFQFMSAFEASFPHRQVPKALLKDD